MPSSVTWWLRASRKLNSRMRVPVFFRALRAQPGAGAHEVVVLAPGGHGEIRKRRRKFVGYLLVDGLENGSGHGVTPAVNFMPALPL